MPVGFLMRARCGTGAADIAGDGRRSCRRGGSGCCRIGDVDLPAASTASAVGPFRFAWSRLAVIAAIARQPLPAKSVMLPPEILRTTLFVVSAM